MKFVPFNIKMGSKKHFSKNSVAGYTGDSYLFFMWKNACFRCEKKYMFSVGVPTKSVTWFEKTFSAKFVWNRKKVTRATRGWEKFLHKFL